ncbi:MAG TPA: ribosome biogenesis GTP-binding protein YihA/YsxC [Candidatus Paceibacterota bacterium]|jgi:GTP-binding protein|nr:ribosome biogenesis GTP-binding protein YihA/YsxC [Candidatus Paceibacterota bacterium]
MNIRSAKFIKGETRGAALADLALPQVAFIGRSNVGKSSTINALTKVKGLAKTSSFPGRTRQINVFLIDNIFYLIDLPGYGYAQVSKADRAEIEEVINSYLFDATLSQAMVVLIIDAFVGPTESDLEMLDALLEHRKRVVILANKIDKVKKSHQKKTIDDIRVTLHGQLVIPFSAEDKIGISEVLQEIQSSLK